MLAEPWQPVCHENTNIVKANYIFIQSDSEIDVKKINLTYIYFSDCLWFLYVILESLFYDTVSCIIVYLAACMIPNDVFLPNFTQNMFYIP